MKTQNICRNCSCLFTPNPKTAGKQKYCSAPECKRASKKASQQKWYAKNKGYFKGRYPYLKIWLEKNPGYLKMYRQKKRDLRKAISENSESYNTRYDIQDELSPVKTIHQKREDDIQEKLNQIISMAHHILYDIQDEISSPKPSVLSG